MLKHTRRVGGKGETPAKLQGRNCDMSCRTICDWVPNKDYTPPHSRRLPSSEIAGELAPSVDTRLKLLSPDETGATAEAVHVNGSPQLLCGASCTDLGADHSGKTSSKPKGETKHNIIATLP